MEEEGGEDRDMEGLREEFVKVRVTKNYM